MKPIRYSLAMLASAGLVSPELKAQSPTSEPGPLVLEEVVVTGSRIKRKDFSSISPLVTLDSERITLSGVTALEDLLNEAPQLVPDRNRAANNPGGGSARLNLRGLGASRTLTTLNGRRLVPSDEFGSADINTIPSQLIDRVEIVTGGASTVYGSDALAGVVNFILKEDFEGVAVTAQYDTYEEGDGDVVDVSAAFGKRFDRGNVTGFINVQERDPVFAGDRAFTNERLQESFFPPTPGVLVPSGSPTTPAGTIVFPRAVLPGTGGAPSQVTFTDDGTPRAAIPGIDQYNFQPANYLQVPLERQSGAVFGNFQLTDQVKLFGELIYSETESTTQLAPPPAFVSAAVNLDNPLLTPAQAALFGASYDPDGDGLADFVFSRRLEETGPRVRTRDADTLRAVFGAEGVLANSWEWEVSYSLSEVRGEEITGNSVFGERFAQALLVDPTSGQCVDPSNGCVPFNPFGLEIPEAAADFLRSGDVISEYEVDEDIVSAVLTGDWLTLPAGKIGFAAGLEWRELSTQSRPDPNFITSNALGLNPDSEVAGSTNVAELYLETLVPLLSGAPFAEYLGIEAGYRYSDYRFSGGVDNWKVGIDWSPTGSLRFRAMAQQAIRAPNINELFRVARVRETGLFRPEDDFCTASVDPVGNNLVDLCASQGIPRDQVGIYEAQDGFPLTSFSDGGNTALDPEEASTLTVGLIYQPTWAEGLSLSVDYYDISIDNAIGTVGVEGGLVLCAQANDPNSQFCSSIVRGPSGDITEYTNPQFNLAKIAARGVDLALDYNIGLANTLALVGSDARLGVQILLNHALEDTNQQTANSRELDCAGYYGGACGFGRGFAVVPEFRGSTRLSYYTGPLTLALNWRWIGELKSHLDITCRDFPESCYASELGDIDARHYFELSGRYELGERFEIYGGITNLSEEDPPLMGLGATQSNTAPQLYDVFGRRFFLGMTYRI